ncbi:hypothetical protein [Patulibacter minatonensis]|uniref:hypothetical protein n=1 Tax=Patulibacter minatonensis TaxID=298163 RepID=UPI00146FB39C|nr:hypothetical protein [Patulibacter minatonensis]
MPAPRSPDDLQTHGARPPAGPPVGHGWVAPDVAEEHPGLELLTWTVATDWPRRTPPAVRDLLARASTRVDGPAVLRAHEDDAPAAHRRFHHRIGRRGDDLRSPIELAYHARIAHGGFAIRGTPHDVLLAVLLETGVPIWALDASTSSGDLGIRRSLLGELRRPEDDPRTPEPGPEPAVVDAGGLVARLGREPGEPRRATRRTRRTTFFCARVPGLPDLRVDEAVWLCRSLAECGTTG